MCQYYTWWFEVEIQGVPMCFEIEGYPTEDEDAVRCMQRTIKLLMLNFRDAKLPIEKEPVFKTYIPDPYRGQVHYWRVWVIHYQRAWSGKPKFKTDVTSNIR